MTHVDAGRHTGSPVADLIDRSNRLGADPRNTNYAGGNVGEGRRHRSGHR
jgi:rhamnose utilization protein RhaD (predicted bifunctional aldolase and dehydrogenase)